MSNQQHTPEPLHYMPLPAADGTYMVLGGQGQDYGLVASCTTEEDARRIVACVNACAGIPTELLELAAEFDAAGEDAVWEPPHPIFRMASDNDRLAKQRDELLAALEDVKIYLQDAQAQRHIYDRVTAAIARVKGGAA